MIDEGIWRWFRLFEEGCKQSERTVIIYLYHKFQGRLENAAIKYDEIFYSIDGKEHFTSYAPVALARLKNLAGAKASVLVTRKAREMHYEKFALELQSAGLQPFPVDIPDGVNNEEIYQIFNMITAQVSEGENIVLDVTFSLRHLPFAYLAALIFLVGLRDVRLEGIYYGAYDLRHDGRAPILEITYLFRLIEWYYGLTTARREGDMRPLGRLLRGDVGRLFQQGVGDKELARISRLAGGLALSLASVLPLEVGLNTNEILKVLDNVEISAGPVLTSHLALKQLSHALVNWRLTADDAVEDVKDKVVLDQNELERQLNLAEWYIERMNLPAALLVLREWMITRLQLAAGHITGWLGYHNRKVYEKTLNAVSERAKPVYDLGTPLERRLASIWKKIANQRNQLAHAGMDSGMVSVSLEEVRDALQECRNLLNVDLTPRLPQNNGEICLVTPLGLSRGVLYSALKLIRPDVLVVVTSEEAGRAIPEILETCGCSELQTKVVQLADAHYGFKEAKEIIPGNRDLSKCMGLAGKVVVNITGGTTAMQFAVERLAEVAVKLGATVEKVALVDRRSYEEQRSNPFVCGELVKLDDD